MYVYIKYNIYIYMYTLNILMLIADHKKSPKPINDGSWVMVDVQSFGHD